MERQWEQTEQPSYSVGQVVYTTNIDSTGIYGILNQSTFNNQATITIISPITIGSYYSVNFGIYNQASFNNNTGGDINIDKSSNSGINNTPGAAFTNQADITIGANKAVGEYGIFNNGEFNNDNGHIKIDRSDTSGIKNYVQGTFTNMAVITIGANYSVGKYGISNEQHFNNNSGGDISIDRSSSRGIWNISNINTIFNNAASISIGGNTSAGQYGIYNETLFNNNSNGNIKIDNTTNAGIINQTDGLIQVVGTNVDFNRKVYHWGERK